MLLNFEKYFSLLKKDVIESGYKKHYKGLAKIKILIKMIILINHFYLIQMNYKIIELF